MATRRPSSTARIPPDARAVMLASAQSFPNHPLDLEFRGRHRYVSHAGDPLCRLSYTGGLGKWDFAVYRYSTGSYRPLEMAPAQDTADNCIRTALGAYDLL